MTGGENFGDVTSVSFGNVTSMDMMFFFGNVTANPLPVFTQHEDDRLGLLSSYSITQSTRRRDLLFASAAKTLNDVTADL